MSLSDTRDLSLQVQVSFALSPATFLLPFHSVHISHAPGQTRRVVNHLCHHSTTPPQHHNTTTPQHHTTTPPHHHTTTPPHHHHHTTTPPHHHTTTPPHHHTTTTTTTTTVAILAQAILAHVTWSTWFEFRSQDQSSTSHVDSLLRV